MHKFNNINSYIRSGSGVITSGAELKISGFFFNKDPSAVHHGCKVIDKFHAKLWTLHFLKRSGMDLANLLKVYFTFVLPSAEYCSIVYGPLIPKYVSEKLESVQKRAMKIIYGAGVDYISLIEMET